MKIRKKLDIDAEMDWARLLSAMPSCGPARHLSEKRVGRAVRAAVFGPSPRMI